MHAVIFLWLIFYDFIEANVPYVNYWDELAACLVFCWGVYDFRRHPELKKDERNNWIWLIALVVIGALGNVFHPGLQENPVVFLKDAVALCKFPLIFFLLERRSVSPEKRQEILTVAAKLSRWILVVMLVGVVVGRFVDLGFYTGEVRILPTFQFVFSHPTFFISSCVMLAAVLIGESIRKNRIFLLVDCLLIFMAQRSKGYIFLVFLLLVILLGEQLAARILKLVFGSETEKVRIGRLLLAAAALVLAVLLVGGTRLKQTLDLGFPVPRTVLHMVGIQILVDFFPLGSGFGTFASYLSGRDYSNIYDLYGISNVIGMTREEYNFISDVFWPYIYGQFGIFGLLIYVKIILTIFFRQFRSGITDSARIAMAVVWIYALIASTSEAYFTNGTGVQMALLLTMFIGYGTLQQKETAN